MNEVVKSLVKYVSTVACITCMIFFFTLHPADICDWWDIIGYTSTITIVFSIAYVKFLWRINPFEKRPRLAKLNSGFIEYDFEEKTCQRPINFIVKQDLLDISIIVETGSNRSVSTSADIKCENGKHVLYYTYITTPDMKVLKGNPIQYGACRLMLDDAGRFYRNVPRLQGIYWNSEKRGGDLECNHCLQLNVFSHMTDRKL